MSEVRNKLELLYEETIAKLSASDRRRCSLKTVENFIFHIDELKHEDKFFVAEKLEEYLCFVKGINSVTTKETEHLYNEYLAPLAEFYLPLGFIVGMNWKGLTYIIILALPILFLLKLSIIYYFIVFSILGFDFIRIYIKKKQHRVYGPLY